MTTIQSSICSICSTKYDAFLNSRNVVGVALGNKIINGIDTGESCLHVLVEKKINKDSLSQNDIIANNYYGIKTDVIEVGKLKSHALTSKIRPLKFGYSIGPYNLNSAGTAGCLVTDGTKYYILSNNHVLANQNTLSIGTSIIQPARIDGGRYPNEFIATLYRYKTLNFSTSSSTPENYIDAAIAYVSNPSLVSSYIESIGYVQGAVTPYINLAIKKSGRTTGLTSGYIKSINATVTISYDINKTALFKNQILSTAISKPGDSGSLVLNNNNYAVGLLFAGSNTVTAFNPISDVLKAMGVMLVIGRASA